MNGLSLVTGGSGFIGGALAKRLVESGMRVRVADVVDDPHRDPRIDFIHCDVRDKNQVSRAMHGVSVVYHCAALVPLTKGDFHAVNTQGSYVVAEAAGREGVGFMVYMSSSAVYGCPKDCPITDETSPSPCESYGASKLGGEAMMDGACFYHGIPLAIIRPRTVIGPGRLGIFGILFDWIRTGASVYTIGGGNIPFQFIHIDDLIDACLMVINHPGTYNIGTDRHGTLRQALQSVITSAKSQSQVRSIPAWLAVPVLKCLDGLGLCPLGPWHYYTYHKPFYFDVSKIKSLGWKPKYSNDEMLAEACGAKPILSNSPHRSRVAPGALEIVRLMDGMRNILLWPFRTLIGFVLFAGEDDVKNT